MPTTPSGVELSTKYTLTGPDGTIATFNLSTDPNFVGYITESTGLDSPEVRENAENIAGADGGIHGSFLYGRRPITLVGQIVNIKDAKERNEKITKLQEASNAMREDAILSWTPTGGEELFMKLRRSQALRVTGGWNKDFQLLMVSADSRIYSKATFEAETSVGAATGVATGVTPQGITSCGNVGPEQILVVNKGSNTLGVYTRDKITGKLTLTESPAVGIGPFGVVATLDGKFVYVTNRGANTVTKFSRNTTTGVLSGAAATATGEEPTEPLLYKSYSLPFVEFLYIPNFKSNSISVFSVTEATGALTLKETVTTGSISGPVQVLESSDAIIVVNNTSGTLGLYKKNDETGKLTFVETVAVAAKPTSAASGGYAPGEGSVVVTGNTGVLTLLSIRAVPIVGLILRENLTVGGKPSSVTLNSDYTSTAGYNFTVSDETANTLQTYSVSSKALVAYGAPTLTGTKPVQLFTRIPPAGNSLASLYSVNQTSATIGEYILSGSNKENIAVSSNSIISCTNKGSMETFPIITMKTGLGKIVAPTFTNLLTGETLSFTGEFVPGDQLVIDMKNKVVTLNGVSAFYRVNFSTSEWWALHPGENKIALNSSEVSAGGTFEVEWKNAWI